MGRTVPTFRKAMEKEMERWKEFRKALRREEREAFDRMMEACKRLSSAGGQAKRPEPLQAMLISILLGQQMRIEALEEKLDEIRKKMEGE